MYIKHNKIYIQPYQTVVHDLFIVPLGLKNKQIGFWYFNREKKTQFFLCKIDDFENMESGDEILNQFLF